MVAPTLALAESSTTYQAVEGRNAQGLTVVVNPRWEYNKAHKTYRLVKKKNASGASVYYKLSDGVLQLGKRAGYYYAFDSQGDMITGAKVIHKIRYYFTPRSKATKSSQSVVPDMTTWGMAVKNDWRKVGESWYYFNSAGRQEASKKGLQRIHGSYYYLNKKFVPCKNCFKEANGKKYYYTASGKRANYTGWKTIQRKMYYFSGGHYVIVKSGWQRIQGKYYYFGKKGNMYARRWLTFGGKLYYLRANGQTATGWIEMRDTYYHFTRRGVLDRIQFRAPKGVVIAQDIPQREIIDQDIQDSGVSLEEVKSVARSYVGRSMKELIAVIGAPLREAGRMPSCQGDGTGEDAMYEYDGFTVMTYEKDGARTVTGVE